MQLNSSQIEKVGGRNNEVALWLVITTVVPVILIAYAIPFSFRKLASGELIDWVGFIVLCSMVGYFVVQAFRLYRKTVRLLRALDKAEWLAENQPLSEIENGEIKIICSVGYIDCPHCQASQMNFISDPRGGTYECGSCNKPFHVPENAKIDLN